MTDKTDRTTSKGELERFRRAVEYAGHAIFTTDVEGTIEYVNPAFEEITGYSEAEAVGRNPRLLKSGVMDDAYYQTLWETILSGEVFNEAVANRNKSGELFYADQTIAPIIEDGEVTAFVAIQKDVTERKERETELEELTTRLQLALDETDTGVWDWNMQTDDVFLDEGCERLFGYETGGFPGTFEAFTSAVHPDDRAQVEAAIEEAIATDDVYQADFRIQRPDGQERWIQSRGVVEYEAGDPVRMYGIQTDITDRKRFEQALQNQNENLELLNRVVRHDIANDISVILGHAQALKAEIDDDELAGRFDTLIKNSKHVMDLTKTLRVLMKTMLADERYLEPVDLTAVLAREIDHARTVSPDAVVTGPEELPDLTVRADTLLGVVLRNLLTNAVYHNDASTPTVSVSVDHSTDDVVVRIADNGRGVADERKDEIFGRGEKGLESAGTGVGLYLVETLVTEYGGEVWVEDNDPCGSVFNVRLQRAEHESQ